MSEPGVTLHVGLEEGDGVGTSGFIVWQRLIRHLRYSGEIKANERVVSLSCDASGITFTVRTV